MLNLLMVSKGYFTNSVLTTLGIVDKVYIGIEGAKEDHIFYQSDDILVVGVGSLNHLGFGELRNNLLKYIPLNQWILQLDSDEYLEGFLNLKTYLANNTGYYAFQLKLHQWHMNSNNQAEFHKISLFRVFKNIEGLRYSGMVHEQFVDYLYEHKYPLGGIIPGGRIIHVGYDTNIEKMYNKIKRNMDLLWRSVWKYGERRGYDYYHLGIMRTWINDYEGALEAYKKALELGIYNNEMKKEIEYKIKLINQFRDNERGI